MRSYREGTFETNSSSTHSMVIVDDSQLEKWKNGDIFYVEDGNKFVSAYEKSNFDKELFGELVVEYADNEDYQDDICDAIQEGRLREYVEEMIRCGEWEVDEYERPLSYEEWERMWDNRDLESDSTEYTTSGGEKIHIFCQYGYEG